MVRFTAFLLNIKNGRTAGLSFMTWPGPLEIGTSASMRIRSVINPSLTQVNQSQLREQQEKAKRAAEDERVRKHEETAAIALSKWNGLSETGQSPYLRGNEFILHIQV